MKKREWGVGMARGEWRVGNFTVPKLFFGLLTPFPKANFLKKMARTTNKAAKIPKQEGYSVNKNVRTPNKVAKTPNKVAKTQKKVVKTQKKVVKTANKEG